MSWRFVRKPKWIVGHVIILAMSLLMIRLAVWQFDRLDERKVYAADLKAELAEPGKPVRFADDLVGLGENRKVTVTGKVSVDNWIFVRNVLNDGVRGFHELVPVRLGDGSVVVVNAGFLSEDQGNDARVGRGLNRSVTITGVTKDPAPTKGNVGETQPFGTGDVPTISAVDTAQLGRFADGEVQRLWVQQLDPQSDLPATLPPPDTSEGPHFSYGLQWVAFTLIITFGYGVLLYRMAKDQAGGAT